MWKAKNFRGKNPRLGSHKHPSWEGFSLLKAEQTGRYTLTVGRDDEPYQGAWQTGQS